MNDDDDLVVDVVIPVRNGARFIEACLDSVMAQTRAARTVVVVDDGSTDASPAILAEYARRWPRLNVIRSEPVGVSHARNLAIRACAAPYVAFLDSDDVWAPEKLERQMAIFAAAGPRVGFVYCDYRCIDARGDPFTPQSMTVPRLRGKVLRDLLIEGNSISGSNSAVVARRDLLERVGGFDERLFFGEDWDLWLRLAEITEVDFVPEPLVSVRLHDRSTQRADDLEKNERFLRQSLLVLDRWYGTPMFAPRLREEYRHAAVHLAILREERQRAWSGMRQLGFIAEIRRGTGRFGRELFSGPLDFLAVLYGMRLMTWRRSAWEGVVLFLAKSAKSMLSPTLHRALKDLIRWNPGSSGK
jgi:glycosyltransferase involved in cell wall biosynthesis